VQPQLLPWAETHGRAGTPASAAPAQWQAHEALHQAQVNCAEASRAAAAQAAQAAQAVAPSGLGAAPVPHPDLPPVQPYDPEKIGTWEYPESAEFAVRKYQFDIASTAVRHNTLVSLPTGLGKTLIAAVVMHNFVRWFPTGRAVFMAPTKPLVHQQVCEARARGASATLLASPLMHPLLPPRLAPKPTPGCRRCVPFAASCASAWMRWWR
jgi:hypothetical protein